MHLHTYAHKCSKTRYRILTWTKIQALVTLLADVLASLHAGIAAKTGITSSGNTDGIANLEVADRRTNLSHGSNALVSKDEGVVTDAPVVFLHVNVSVA